MLLFNNIDGVPSTNCTAQDAELSSCQCISSTCAQKFMACRNSSPSIGLEVEIFTPKFIGSCLSSSTCCWHGEKSPIQLVIRWSAKEAGTTARKPTNNVV